MKSFRQFTESAANDDLENWLDHYNIVPVQPTGHWMRVVWSKSSPTKIETTEPDSLGYPEGFGTFWGIHVTQDPDFWIEMLANDYKRPREDAHVLDIKTIPGDVLVRDRQYKPKKGKGTLASSAVLLTTRANLKAGQDFIVVDWHPHTKYELKPTGMRKTPPKG